MGEGSECLSDRVRLAKTSGAILMLPYLLLLVLTAWMAMAHMQPQPATGFARPRLSWRAFFLLLVIIIGFRHEVGADWEGYLIHLEEMHGEPLNAVFYSKDPAYGLMNWLGANVGGGIYLVNGFCSVLFVWGLAAFCRCQPRPWLSLLVALPYLILVVAMGYTRQGVAISLTMIAITRLERGNVNNFLLWMILAALFHKSALILVPFAVFAASRYRLLTLFGIAVSAIALFALLLLDQIDYFARNYVEIELESSGAGIRIAMSVVPAILFLFFRNRFGLPPKIRGFWLWMAWSALLLIPLLMVSPSSAAIDRIALYWIPLQLQIYSRLPDVFGVPGRRNPLWVTLIVAYSASMMLGWLSFASFASFWLPYRFYPWEALWA